MVTRLLCSLLATASCVFAQGIQMPMVPEEPQTSQSEKLPPFSVWKEMEEKRTLFTSTYKLPDGRIVVRNNQRPINYPDASGRLHPIDPGMKPSENGWAAPHQPFPVYFNHDASTALTMDNGEKMQFNKNCEINSIDAGGTPVWKGNTAMIQDIVPGVDKEIIFGENSVKYNYILKQRPVVEGMWFKVEETVVLPEGYQFGSPEEGDPGSPYDLLVYNKELKVTSRFCAPFCYDAENKPYLGEYLLSALNNTGSLTIRVSMTWLNDPARVYPVVIDPLVIGPTSTWTGGTMPSCIVPQYNNDSLQVTIPAGISITALYVTSSYYADPFTTAVMSQGSMRFRTSCAQSTNFTVPNPQGNTPGTAYLDSFDLRNPLLCCFAPACTLRTFWLTMMLGRTGPSTGCNTTYIRYNPFTQWPFSALVVGRTPESFGQQWVVPTNAICGNQCTFVATVYIRYGVPPYTITHPWLQNPIVVNGTTVCGTSAAQVPCTLTVPNCPVYCDTTSFIPIPSPVVTDACGMTVSSYPPRNLPLKIAPDITAIPDTIVACSGDTFNISLSSCVSLATLNWNGNSQSDTGSITDFIINTGTSPSSSIYNVAASYNGCYSDTAQVLVIVDPLPLADFTWSPSQVIAGVPANFTDVTTVYGGSANSWSWTFGDNGTSTSQNPTHTYAEAGIYTVCLSATTSNGCPDSVCKVIEVISPEIYPPNVVTPNGDGMNDYLKFKYLEFFAGNRLEIYNRWGGLIYSKDGYANDWIPEKLSNGTYYYVLDVPDLDKKYAGFFQVLH